MNTVDPIARHLVLLGGGHSHVIVLRMLGMNPVPGLQVTLISPDRRTPYSGMLPGYVAGHYREEEIHIELDPLCRFAGAGLIQGSVTGLDPQARHMIWSLIHRLKRSGKTILITTHYMEEADNLCDRVGIIDYGKIQIVDTPESMKNKLETDMITFSIIPDENKQEQFIEKIKKFDLIKNVDINERNMTVQSSNSTQAIPKIFQASSEIGISIDSFVLNKPTLDDVFISYTGHNLRDDTNEKFNKRKEYNQSRRRGL